MFAFATFGKQNVGLRRRRLEIGGYLCRRFTGRHDFSSVLLALQAWYSVTHISFFYNDLFRFS